MTIRSLAWNVLIVAMVASCATSRTTSRTWNAPPSPPPGMATTWTKPGRVQSVSEIVQRVQGDPAGGAVLGALIGGFLFGHHGHASLFGAATGAAMGAAVSQGSTESRTFQLLVRFDDGTYGMFVFAGPPPFQPGQAVVLTPYGLAPG